LAKLTATENTLTGVDEGIIATLASAGGILIDDNTITNAHIGIKVGHADPNGSVTITNNEISTNTNPGEEGVGIWLFENKAPTLVKDNIPITVKGTGVGMLLESSSRAVVSNNRVILDNTDEAEAGIVVENVYKTRLFDNWVIGDGITGDANENIGLEIACSPGNAYCCNILNNTRLGIRIFGGSASENLLRGTTFGTHYVSLLLPDVNAVLGTQEHTRNRWLEETAETVYDVPSIFAQAYPFIVDITLSNGHPTFAPESPSPSEWFDVQEDPSPVAPCDLCGSSTGFFAPTSNDTKRIANGDTTLLPAVSWELQRYIYGKLNEIPGDTTNGKFRANAENSTIGYFQVINDEITSIFAADSVSRAQLKTNLVLADEKLDTMILIDSLLLVADSLETIGLMQNPEALVDALVVLGLDNDDLVAEITDNFTAAAVAVHAINDTITVVEDFEINEKVVNDLYLAYLAEADTSATDTLEIIAAQCPLLGGNAVYRARTLLALMTGELVSYNDSLICAEIESFSRHGLPAEIAAQVQELSIYPNPANKEVKVSWRQPVRQSGSLTLYDLHGRKVLGLILGEGEATRTIALPDLPGSVYVLRLQLDEQDFVKKIAIKY